VSKPVRVVTLCTGNVARSVMVGAMLSVLAEYEGVALSVRTAGTHAIEGAAISGRTRDAIARIPALDHLSLSSHRSRQLTDDDVAWADIILAAEADHVRLVRQWHPDAAPKVIQLRRFAAAHEEPWREFLMTQAAVDPDDRDDVVDPAGGEQADYDACAQALWELAQAVVPMVTR
jgi:protein-tyrosine-phosphatase